MKSKFKNSAVLSLYNTGLHNEMHLKCRFGSTFTTSLNPVTFSSKRTQMQDTKQATKTDEAG